MLFGREKAAGVLQNVHEALHGKGDDQGAYGRSSQDHQLRRLEEDMDISPLHHEPAYDTT